MMHRLVYFTFLSNMFSIELAQRIVFFVIVYYKICFPINYNCDVVSTKIKSLPRNIKKTNHVICCQWYVDCPYGAYVFVLTMLICDQKLVSLMKFLTCGRSGYHSDKLFYNSSSKLVVSNDMITTYAEKGVVYLILETC